MNRKDQILTQIQLVADEMKSLREEKKRLQTQLALIEDKEDYTTGTLSKEGAFNHIINLFKDHNKPKLFCIHGMKFYCNAGNVESDGENIMLKMKWNGVIQPTVILNNVGCELTIKHFDRYILCVPDRAQLRTHEGNIFTNDI